MSGSGVYYTTDQLTAMDMALTQARAAFSAGDAQGAIAAVDSYYELQIYNPADGTIMRGCAELAQATADDTGIGIAPNQEVAKAIGQANYNPYFKQDWLCNSSSPIKGLFRELMAKCRLLQMLRRTTPVSFKH